MGNLILIKEFLVLALLFSNILLIDIRLFIQVLVIYFSKNKITRDLRYIKKKLFFGWFKKCWQNSLWNKILFENTNNRKKSFLKID